LRVVLDTNILISAAIVPEGPSAGTLAAWAAGSFELALSAAILTELSRVLRYPRIARRLNWSPDDEQTFMAPLLQPELQVSPVREITVCRDPADNRVLEAAVAGQADYIVSGDLDLLALGEFEGIPIVTPAQFLAILTAGGV
jgi:putative PIN family toxin of toxin-antitoxin system